MRLVVNGFLVILGGCSFGLLAPIVKLSSFNGIPIADSTRMQLFFGFILLAFINLFFVKYRLRPKTFIKLLLSGIPMGLTTTFIYKSLNYLDASIAIVLLFQYVWMGLVAELIVTRRLPTREKVIATALILVGSLFAVNIFTAHVNQLPLLGIMWGLLAAVSFATFIFVSGKVATYVPPLRKSMMMALGGLLIILILYPPTDLAIEKVNGYFLLHGLTLGVFGGVLPPLLFSLSIPVVGNALGSILSSSELPTTVIFSAIILSEKISVFQGIGIVLIISAIVLANVVHLKIVRAVN